MEKVGYVEFVALAEKYAIQWAIEEVENYNHVFVELDMVDERVIASCILDDGNSIRMKFTIPEIEHENNVIFEKYR